MVLIIPIEIASQQYEGDNPGTFHFLRHPLDRLVSAYRMIFQNWLVLSNAKIDIGSGTLESNYSSFPALIKVIHSSNISRIAKIQGQFFCMAYVTKAGRR